jgi:hypothetical protein
MERKYVFRGMDENREWNYGDLEHKGEAVYVNKVRVIPETVGQGIGGIGKIFAGDKIRYFKPHRNGIQGFRPVFYIIRSDDGFYEDCSMVLARLKAGKSVEVVGNVFKDGENAKM